MNIMEYNISFLAIVLWCDTKREDGLSCLADTSGSTYLYRREACPDGPPPANSLIHFSIEFTENNGYNVTFVAPYVGYIGEEDVNALDEAAKKYHRSIRERQKQRRELAQGRI